PNGCILRSLRFFFTTTPPPPQPSPLSLHDALPIFSQALKDLGGNALASPYTLGFTTGTTAPAVKPVLSHGDITSCIQSDTLSGTDRKSTRLNSSHLGISYAVFCLKKKKKNRRLTTK